MIRVFVVDDQQLVRKGFCSILGQIQDIDVVGEAADGETALREIEKVRPHVVLMDLRMPGIGGIEATRTIRRRWPEIQVVAVTSHSELPFPDQLYEAGALGFVSKGCEAEDLTHSVRAAAERRPFMSADVAQRLALARVSSDARHSPIELLSAREFQVMLMIVRGSGNPEIAERLHLSPKTISTYRHRIYEKLNVSNDVALTLLALRLGIVEQG